VITSTDTSAAINSNTVSHKFLLRIWDAGNWSLNEPQGFNARVIP
jgi:hypothetical protein